MSTADRKGILFAVAAALILTGWYANDVTRWVQEIHRKAQVCDDIHCDELVRQGDLIKAAKPPVLR